MKRRQQLLSAIGSTVAQRRADGAVTGLSTPATATKRPTATAPTLPPVPIREANATKSAPGPSTTVRATVAPPKQHRTETNTATAAARANYEKDMEDVVFERPERPERDASVAINLRKHCGFAMDTSKRTAAMLLRDSDSESSSGSEANSDDSDSSRSSTDSDSSSESGTSSSQD